jgi:sec-independent protein translocase protein TatA
MQRFLLHWPPQLKETAMPGMGELVVILLIVLVVFGANKLPGIGDALGRSIKNFKKASNVDDEPKAVEAGAKGGQLEAAPANKELSAGSSDDGEWEEVVVRRKKKKEA